MTTSLTAASLTVEDTDLHALDLGADPRIPDTGMRYLALSLGRALTEPEANRLAALTGYAWRARMNGATRLTHHYDPAVPDRIHFYDDFWDVGRSDPVRAWSGFVRLLTTYVEEGTPLRSTNRAGVGTKGTRLVAGFGPADAANLRVYADKTLELSAAAFLQAMSGIPTRT